MKGDVLRVIVFIVCAAALLFSWGAIFHPMWHAIEDCKADGGTHWHCIWNARVAEPPKGE